MMEQETDGSVMNDIGIVQADLTLQEYTGHKPSVDYWLLGLFGVFFVLGLLAVLSSSYFLSYHTVGHGSYYITRHVFHMILAVITGAITYAIPVSVIRSVSPFVLLIVVLLLILVLLPGIGRSVNGATRWIHFLGINIQVSEIAKLGLIVYLSSYIQRKQYYIQESVRGVLTPLLVMGVLGSLVLLEPDFGGFFVILTIGIGMLFFAGLPWRVILTLMGVVGVLMLALVYMTPYRLARLTAFFDPWKNPFGDSYQLTQSLMAIGRGGVFGVGLGQGLQKQLYLPEAHTDFIYAILAEETGLLGSAFIIMCFMLLVGRLGYWVYKASKKGLCYEAMCLYGMMIWWSVSAMFSMSVNLGLVPTKGIALPFFSYGGSNLLVNAIAIGVLLRITREVGKV
ncbi:putative lipid II flippase FtsW [Candidatus Synchoanobacter obligatus]|uniref:Probable peptidoglycan glycosyltransferase FtsW n=1 Tax=Candidatus Synchoanobacter obligatus TaxID=2919597 RepID=A0ABT1L8S2_9GAMM|nr:putative lipid II flippase FtsW [Candidatus Synchoanobacter obligatus]MCP8352543.1 putative lipid II flippase FtsW [Candidatus Synchoanobacter obligatus]